MEDPGYAYGVFKKHLTLPDHDGHSISSSAWNWAQEIRYFQR